jgi:hypothetical protein
LHPDAALEEFTRERAPTQWALTQMNLSLALGMLGQRGDDAALGRAASVFEAALEEAKTEEDQGFAGRPSYAKQISIERHR